MFLDVLADEITNRFGRHWRLGSAVFDTSLHAAAQPKLSKQSNYRQAVGTFE
jgi:hypothetical protein